MIKIINKTDTDYIYILQKTFSNLFTKENELIEDINSNPFLEIYIFEKDNKDMGILLISNIYDRYEVDNIYVLEEFRNKHIATELFKYMIEKGKKENIRNITLEVRKDNYNAIKLYKNFLFVEKAIRKSYYNGIDGLLMEKEMM